MAATNSPFQRRYPAEMRERAVRMVREAIAESGERVGAVTRVARQLALDPSHYVIGSSELRSTAASALASPPQSSSRSPSLSARCASYAEPTRS